MRNKTVNKSNYITTDEHAYTHAHSFCSVSDKLSRCMTHMHFRDATFFFKEAPDHIHRQKEMQLIFFLLTLSWQSKGLNRQPSGHKPASFYSIPLYKYDVNYDN